MVVIPKEEFEQRIEKICGKMDERKLDAVIVYGDEYRKENLRYVSNFWPIFERAFCFIGKKSRPILAGGAEGERYCREMSIWDDVRNLKECACVSVAEDIDYPLSQFATMREIVREVSAGGKRIGVCGCGDMPGNLLNSITDSIDGIEVIKFDEVLSDLRLIKSENEIACLKKCGEIACKGYEDLRRAVVPGNTELMAAGAGEGTCRKLGAEAINFMVFSSGQRTGTVIGRATEKIMREGEMVIASMAVQYEGYVTTVEFPMAAGEASDEQKFLLGALFEAANVQLSFLKDGVVSSDMVKAVRDVFRKHKLDEYDLYPPMHGTGLAEAERPYPDENSRYKLRKGMCVNSDISLFGHRAGSNRIEEGFVIRENGVESLTPLIRELCEKGIDAIE